MASSKELFLRDKEDVKEALKITTSTTFDKMLAFARAEFSQLNPSSEQCAGVSNFIIILKNLPDDEAPDLTPIESGLHHDLSVPTRDQPKTDNKK